MMDFDSKAKTWDDDPLKTERARAVAEQIRARVPLTAEMTGFEYGCGTGLLSFALKDDLRRITLADSSEGMLDVLRGKLTAAGVNNLHPVKLDLATDPLPAERFNLICSLMTFHHVPDIDKVLRAFHALLTSPGHLCVADLDSEDGSFHGAGFDGHQGFDRDELRRRVEQAGFGKVEFSTVFRISKGGRDYPVFLLTAEKV